MKKILIFSLGAFSFMVVYLACHKPLEKFNSQPSQSADRSTQTFEMVDKSGQYYEITIKQSSYSVAYYHIEPISTHSETLEPGFKLACPYTTASSTVATLDSTKYHWFVPISGDGPFMFSGTHITINCFCEDPQEGSPHCDKLPLGSSGRFICMPQDCYDCDWEICIDTCPWDDPLNQPGFIIEAESVRGD